MNEPIHPTTDVCGEPGELLLIFGGSFDPPHQAHITQPARVREAVSADAVVYIPAAQPPHKRHLRQTPAHHRLAMLQRALANAPAARLSTVELDRAADGRPSYTVDTLRQLRQTLPTNTRMRLLIGADQVLIFDQWHQYEQVEQLAEPVVMLRPPMTRRQLLAELPNDAVREKWAGRLVETPPMPISSTQIREAIAAGQVTQVQRWLDPAVLDYIREHRLYVT